jgi:hypothetical protein
MRIASKLTPVPVLSLALLLGCSAKPEEAQALAFESGSRLRAQIADGGEGAVVLEAWKDTELNELCEFHYVTDGSIRCVPVFGGARLVYTDPECKGRAAAVDPTCSVGSKRYVTSIDEAYTCPTAVPPVAVYSLGAPMGNRTAYVRDERGLCSEYGVDVSLVEVTEASLGAFVAATVSREDIGDGLSVSVLEGEDGSRMLHRLHDASGERCSPALLDEGRLGEAYPCLPEGWASVDHRGPYADASCEEPLQQLPSWCPKPSLTVVEEKPADTCDAPKRSIREVGDLVKTAGLRTYNEDNGACNATTEGPSQRGSLYAIGEAVAPETFPALTWASSGAGRLRSRHWATPSGKQASVAGGHPLSSGFYDETLKTTCYAAEFDDGRTRCVPAPIRYISEGEYFGDPKCEQRLEAERVAENQCSAGGFVLYARSAAEPSGCLAGPPLTALYTVGDSLAGEKLWYRDDENQCRKVMFTAGIHTLDPVALSTFAEISVRVE